VLLERQILLVIDTAVLQIMEALLVYQVHRLELFFPLVEEVDPLLLVEEFKDPCVQALQVQRAQ
jgi:hypothetical protein